MLSIHGQQACFTGETNFPMKAGARSKFYFFIRPEKPTRLTGAKEKLRGHDARVTILGPEERRTYDEANDKRSAVLKKFFDKRKKAALAK